MKLKGTRKEEATWDERCPYCGHPIRQHLDGTGCSHYDCQCLMHYSALIKMRERAMCGEDPLAGVKESRHGVTDKHMAQMIALKRDLEKGRKRLFPRR